MDYFNYIKYQKITEMYTKNRAQKAIIMIRMSSLRPIGP